MRKQSYMHVLVNMVRYMRRRGLYGVSYMILFCFFFFIDFSNAQMPLWAQVGRLSVLHWRKKQRTLCQ